MSGGLPDSKTLSVSRHRSIDDIVPRPWIAITVVVVFLTAILLLTIPRPLSSDISGQLWIADRLRHGARLYFDISEINPPLWFWLAIPVEWLAQTLGVRAEDTLIAAMGGAALLGLLATNCLFRHYPKSSRVALLLYGACILLVMPLRDLGQREQIALIAALPYAALIAARSDRRHVPGWLAVPVALGAAVGFALKHYFVAVPVLLELWLILRLRGKWRPVRPEPLILAACAFMYVTAILIATPGYLQVSVPELTLAYGAFGAQQLNYMIRPAQPVWVLIVSGIVAQHFIGRRPWSSDVLAFLIAGGGFFAAWLIQHKGWPYQSIATTGMLALAMAAMLAENAFASPARRSVIAMAALVFPVLLFAVPTQWVPTPDTDIAAALADLKSGDAVAIVSREGRTAWPSTVDRGFRFSGRRGSYWMFAAIDANRAGTRNPAIDAFGRKILREAVLDYRCLPPKRIVFVPGRAPASVTTASDNPLRYFSGDPEFADFLRHYRRLDRPGNFDVFQLSGTMPALRSDLCPRVL